MSSLQFRRLKFPDPFIPEFSHAQIPAPDSSALTLTPVSPGVARVTLSVGGARAMLSATRQAEVLALPAEFYRSHAVDADGERAVDLFDQFSTAADLRLAYAQESPRALVLDETFFALQDASNHARLRAQDPAKWALETDLRLDVRAQELFRVLRTLRGPGRTLRADSKVDLILHGPLPINIPGNETCFARVVTAQRLDTMTRVDFVSMCSARFIESVGVRFSLPPMIDALSMLVADRDADPVLSLGFDQQLRAVWLGYLASRNSLAHWHADDALQMHSSQPYQPDLKEASQ
jgi:hypothetical protein